MDELIRGSPGAQGAQGLISDLHQGRLVVRARRNALELVLLFALFDGLQLGSTLLEQAGQVNGLLDLYRETRARIGTELLEQGPEPVGAESLDLIVGLRRHETSPVGIPCSPQSPEETPIYWRFPRHMDLPPFSTSVRR